MVHRIILSVRIFIFKLAIFQPKTFIFIQICYILTFWGRRVRKPEATPDLVLRGMFY